MDPQSFIEVAFPIPLDRTFHYQGEAGRVGCRVLAPFGPRKNLIGYVVAETREKPSFPTKGIQRWIDTEPFLDEKLIPLARWLADRYLCSWGEALACIVPAALAAPKRTPKIPSPLVGEDEGGGEENVFVAPHPAPSPTRGEGIRLSAEQKRALAPLLASVDKGEFRPFLLRGITDSGKTEIYLRTIDRAIAQGHQALFLLPEIALTPPFFSRLKERYDEHRVGLWHSGVSGGERYRTWQAVRDGNIQVLLGARSAVFAPFPNLGVIVLDEEHEPAYKQEERPRYHTREVALKRAEMCSAVLIMGSATPSLESYWKAKGGVYTLLELTSRVEERQLPPVELIDRRPPNHNETDRRGRPPRLPEMELKSRARTGPRPYGSSVFSEPLRLAIEQRLARREQVMLFVNRRGYTPFLRCSVCGWVARCSRCSMTLTLHLGQPNINPDYLQCHACLRREPVPVQCPSCRSRQPRPYGIGTEKVEQEVKRLFPFARIARLDRDVATSHRRFESIYNAVSEGKVDVLVGTQMIAKGFDFPRVTLVGVVDADVSLHLPDFRSAERTFDLLTQVAGRTGRGGGKSQVLVQTHHPEHYALQAARAHDYLGFYDKEIGDREALNYPPFCRLVRILLRSSKEANVHQAGEDLAVHLERLESGAVILGPAPAPYSRIRYQYRYQILVKGSEPSLEKCLDYLRSYRCPKAFMVVDVEPADLL
jgi:primosomal protein N' (replication factor Y) (superfamily II helicase)